MTKETALRCQYSLLCIYIYIYKSYFRAGYPWVKQCLAVVGGEAGVEIWGQAPSPTSLLFLEGHFYPALPWVPRLFASQG